MSYVYKKIPVNMTPGAQYAIMNKADPGRFLENQDCINGDLPVVLPSRDAALKFLTANGIPPKSAEIVSTSDTRYFMPGDNVYLAEPEQV